MCLSARRVKRHAVTKRPFWGWKYYGITALTGDVLTLSLPFTSTAVAE
jgi:hypothetical protein